MVSGVYVTGTLKFVENCVLLSYMRGENTQQKEYFTSMQLLYCIEIYLNIKSVT